MTRAEELCWENYHLTRAKVDYEKVITGKDKEIGDLKAQLEKFQELMKESKEQRENSPLLDQSSTNYEREVVDLDEPLKRKSDKA